MYTLLYIIIFQSIFRKSKAKMERGGGGLFMKLAPELLLVFLNYLYVHDIAKLRCVSKWLVIYNVIFIYVGI